MGDVKPSSMEEKPMCFHLVLFFHLPLSTSLLFYPTTFMENGCWWLGELLSLGVGWQGCQSLAHMPTPPTTFHSLHSIPVSSPSRPRLMMLTRSSSRFMLTRRNMVCSFLLSACSPSRKGRFTLPRTFHSHHPLHRAFGGLSVRSS